MVSRPIVALLAVLFCAPVFAQGFQVPGESFKQLPKRALVQPKLLTPGTLKDVPRVGLLAPGKCSIPLINVTPREFPKELQMPTIRPNPQIDPQMILPPPAPACKDWPPK
jgi:hypothetical protein